MKEHIYTSIMFILMLALTLGTILKICDMNVKAKKHCVEKTQKPLECGSLF